MKKGVLIAVIAGAVLIFAAGFFVLTNNKGNNGNSQMENENAMVDCGKMQNPSCFSNRMNTCLPVTAQLTATDGTTSIDLTVLGYENETCHFQRKVNNILNLDCYLPKGNLTWDLIDQTFGNDKGLQKTVDDSCKSV